MADRETDDSASESSTDGGAVPPGTVELLALLDAQYGDRYDTERRDELRDSVGSLRGAAESLDEAELRNGDEPAFTFAAYRGEE